jgi:hypothetical protein
MAEQSQEIKEISISELDPRFVKNIENAEKSLSVFVRFWFKFFRKIRPFSKEFQPKIRCLKKELRKGENPK